MVWKIKEENIPQPIEFIKKLINDTHYTSLFSTFFLDKKSGAKKSRQIQMLRWICRAIARPQTP